MDMTETFGKTSEAIRLKVGAMLYKNGAIISLGCNGTPSGYHTNECEDKIYHKSGNLIPLEWSEFPYTDERGRYGLKTKECVVHAEDACLRKMWNSHETTEGCIMFVSHAPCLPCSLKIKDAKISKVYYRHQYRSTEGVEYLLENGVEVEQL